MPARCLLIALYPREHFYAMACRRPAWAAEPELLRGGKSVGDLHVDVPQPNATMYNCRTWTEGLTAVRPKPWGVATGWNQVETFCHSLPGGRFL